MVSGVEILKNQQQKRIEKKQKAEQLKQQQQLVEIVEQSKPSVDVATDVVTSSPSTDSEKKERMGKTVITIGADGGSTSGKQLENFEGEKEVGEKKKPKRKSKDSNASEGLMEEGLHLAPVGIKRRMADTKVDMTELVLPSHANTLGIAFGGQIMKWMENCASITASRFTKTYVLTCSVDELRFLNSINVRTSPLLSSPLPSLLLFFSHVASSSLM